MAQEAELNHPMSELRARTGFVKRLKPPDFLRDLRHEYISFLINAINERFKLLPLNGKSVTPARGSMKSLTHESYLSAGTKESSEGTFC